ncbi:hypothetical protein [Thalassospira marina]|uniref:Uncharacterized protein n=1 Tax=Thalassospira marina TaxID=2048283 RepID=A0ABN5FEN4_9PROT|nr:hypothetical protein [Thalassospira marina]AUG53486.1 hypothetical protein CSC3H3_12755 [Thalassospira marina]
MKYEIEKTLREIGGDRLARQWQREHEQTPVKRLPTAYLDKLALGYAIALGAMAASIDLVMDQVFRDEMAEIHRDLTDDPQAKKNFEDAAKQKMEELGVSPTKEQKEEIRRKLEEVGVTVDPRSIPDSAMDFYCWLNEKLGLDSPLFPNNHRILNHTDKSTVIKMLMNGEAGIGDLLLELYPKMSEEAAREIYELHIAADRHTSRSLPLKIMSWLWEQGIRAKQPNVVGAPNFLFDLLQKYAPNIEWEKWIETFFGEEGVKKFLVNGEWPEGLSIGDVMLKLYEKGLLNERVFWTSDLGAAVGGIKRRIIIAATMEAGVEVFALVEGLSSGFVTWNNGSQLLASTYLEWRDQPKYLNMRTLAQATAAAGPAVRSLWTGDAFSQNIPSLAMTMRHLWVSSNVRTRHTERLVAFSKNDCALAIAEFESSTGLLIRKPRALIEGGKDMAKTLARRLDSAGCFSTRVAVLATQFPFEMKEIVERIENLATIAEDNNEKLIALGAICETWYLSDITDDTEAIRSLQTDIRKLEQEFGVLDQ